MKLVALNLASGHDRKVLAQRFRFAYENTGSVVAAMAAVNELLAEENLHLGLSARFKVVVTLPEDKHRLLLFLRLKDKVKEPSDRPGCQELLDSFARLDVDALVDRYGARGVYVKATRLPVGAPAGLPAIVRQTASSPAETFARDGGGGLLSDVARDIASALRAEDLRILLTDYELPSKGPKAELIDRLVGAFRAGRVALESILAQHSADYVREVCATLDLPLGKKSDNLDRILKYLAAHHSEGQRDGPLFERDETGPG